MMDRSGNAFVDRRAELAATRAYLDWLTPDDPLHGRFLAYLRSLVDYLESSLAAGLGDRSEDEVCWKALRDSLPLAQEPDMRQWPVPVLDLDDDDGGLLAEVRLCRRILSLGGTPEKALDDLAWILAWLEGPLELLLLSWFMGGRDACVARLGGLGDDVRLDAEGRAESEGVVGWWDEEPCYARHPATAPGAFLARAPAADRRAEAAAVRVFLEGLEPAAGDQGAFAAACLALVDRLERDLALGEVDPDWEDLLWRLLRAFLPLADPAWRAAHRVEPALLGAAERRRVARLGRYCAAARPGQEGEAASRARGMIVGAATSALRIYARGRCSLGLADWEAAANAFLRYVRRDWG